MLLPQLKQEVRWSPEHSDSLAKLLQSELGRRLLEVLILAAPAPTVQPGQTAERQLGVMRGYEVCLQNIVNLTSVEKSDDMLGASALQRALAELDDEPKS